MFQFHSFACSYLVFQYHLLKKRFLSHWMVFTTLSKISRVYFWILNWVALISVYAPPHACLGGFPGGSGVKNPPAIQEMQVRSPGQEDPPGEGNGNLLKYYCLGNPTDRGAWLGYHSIGLQRVRHGWTTLSSLHSSYNISFLWTYLILAWMKA